MSPNNVPVIWPEGAPGTEVLRVNVELSVDTLFGLLFDADSAFMAAANKARGHKNYTETEWHHSKQDELRHAVSTPNLHKASNGKKPTLRNKSHLAKKNRNVKFEAAALGMKFTTEEAQHCLEAVEGRAYTVECIVTTTAKYGETFRTIIRYWLTSQGISSSELKVAYTIVLLQPLSKIIRSIVFKGVDNGLRRNFGGMLDLLRQRAPVTDKLVVTQPEPDAAEAGQQSGLPNGAVADNSHWRPPAPQPYTVTIGITRELKQAMQPWAVRIAAALPAIQGFVGTDGLTTALCAGGLVLSLCVALSILNQLLAMSRGTPGWFSVTCAWLLSFLQLPESFMQLLSSLGLVLLVQHAFTAVLSSRSSNAQPKVQAASPRLQNITRLPSEMEYARGVQYEGFASAMQRIGEGGPTEGPPEGPVGHTPASRKKPGVKGFGKWFQEAIAKQPPPSGVHPSASAPGLHPQTPDEANGIQPQEGAAEQATAQLGEVVGSPPNSRSFTPEALLQRLRTSAQTNRSDTMPAQTVAEVPSNKENEPVPPPRTLTVQASDNLSSLLKASWQTFINVEGSKGGPEGSKGGPEESKASLEGSKGALEGSKEGAVEAASAAEGQLNSIVEQVHIGPTHLRSESITYEASLSQQELQLYGNGAQDKVLELVYENERFQPLRGWGHMWPGHFLPTDRVNHWSSPHGRTSADFEDIVPTLDEGWEWVEPEWRIDMTGHADGLVDAHGWRYALDFMSMKPSRAVGSGRSKLKDFVRRRTWVRMRMRTQDVAQDIADNGATEPAPSTPSSHTLWIDSQRSYSDCGMESRRRAPLQAPRGELGSEDLERSSSTPVALNHDTLDQLVVTSTSGDIESKSAAHTAEPVDDASSGKPVTAAQSVLRRDASATDLSGSRAQAGSHRPDVSARGLLGHVRQDVPRGSTRRGARRPYEAPKKDAIRRGSVLRAAAAADLLSSSTDDEDSCVQNRQQGAPSRPTSQSASGRAALTETAPAHQATVAEASDGTLQGIQDLPYVRNSGMPQATNVTASSGGQTINAPAVDHAASVAAGVQFGSVAAAGVVTLHDNVRAFRAGITGEVTDRTAALQGDCRSHAEDVAAPGSASHVRNAAAHRDALIVLPSSASTSTASSPRRSQMQDSAAPSNQQDKSAEQKPVGRALSEERRMPDAFVKYYGLGVEAGQAGLDDTGSKAHAAQSAPEPAQHHSETVTGHQMSQACVAEATSSAEPPVTALTRDGQVCIGMSGTHLATSETGSATCDRCPGNGGHGIQQHPSAGSDDRSKGGGMSGSVTLEPLHEESTMPAPADGAASRGLLGDVDVASAVEPSRRQFTDGSNVSATALALPGVASQAEKADLEERGTCGSSSPQGSNKMGNDDVVLRGQSNQTPTGETTTAAVNHPAAKAVDNTVATALDEPLPECTARNGKGPEGSGPLLANEDPLQPQGPSGPPGDSRGLEAKGLLAEGSSGPVSPRGPLAAALHSLAPDGGVNRGNSASSSKSSQISLKVSALVESLKLVRNHGSPSHQTSPSSAAASAGAPLPSASAPDAEDNPDVSRDQLGFGSGTAPGSASGSGSLSLSFSERIARLTPDKALGTKLLAAFKSPRGSNSGDVSSTAAAEPSHQRSSSFAATALQRVRDMRITSDAAVAVEQPAHVASVHASVPDAKGVQARDPHEDSAKAGPCDVQQSNVDK